MRSLLFLTTSLLLLNCYFTYVYAGLEVVKELSDEDVFLQNKYKEMDTAIKRFTERGFKSLLPNLLEASEAMNLSAKCIGNFLGIGSGVLKMKLWAFEFLDATGKFNEGILNYNPHILGNFEQCLSATSRKKNGEVDFRGRYCTIRYTPYLPDPGQTPDPYFLLRRTYTNTRNLSEILQYALFRSQEGDRYVNFYGFCVPSGCTSRDVEKIFKYVGDMIYMNFSVEYCQVKSETSYLNTRKIIIICIFAIFGILGITSSAVEYYSKSRKVEFKGLGAKILRCFCITTNFQKLISTQTETEMLSCIHGIRVLSMFYIMLTHKFVILSFFNFTRDFLPNVIDYVPTFFFQIILNGFICVESFFFLSGFLNTYVRMKLSQKDKTFTWWILIIHRLWRILPAYIVTILLVYLLTPTGPIGPYFKEVYIENCNGEWWKNLVFVNNFTPENKCLNQTWYIACDMQMFLISLITVPIVMKNPKRGFLVTTAVIICGLVTTMLWIGIKKFAPTFLIATNVPSGKDDMLLPYMTIPSHIATYFSGTLMGYYMSVKKNIKIPKIYQVIGWTVAIFLYVTILFLPYRWQSGIEYTNAESMLYFAFSKPLTALAVGWMLFCCISGHGGIINYILSLKLWIPLSRLTFTIYLTSFPLQFFFAANIRHAKDTQWMIWIWEYVGDVLISCLLALSISVIMENPIIALEKLVFGGEKKKQETENIGNIAIKTITIQESKSQSDAVSDNQKS